MKLLLTTISKNQTTDIIRPDGWSKVSFVAYDKESLLKHLTNFNIEHPKEIKPESNHLKYMFTYTNEVFDYIVTVVETELVHNIKSYTCSCGCHFYTHRHTNMIECVDCNKIELL